MIFSVKKTGVSKVSKFKDKIDAWFSEHKTIHKICINVKNYFILVLMVFTYVFIGNFYMSYANYGDEVTGQVYYCVLTALVCGGFYMDMRKNKVAKEYPHKLSVKRVLLYAFEFIFISVAILSVFEWIHINISDPTIADVRSRYADTKLNLYYLAACTIVPVAEECMMRLFLYNLLKTGSHWIVSMCISSFVFAAFHLTWSHAVLATVFGMLMCLIYECTGRYWVSMLGHISYNVIALFVSPFLPYIVSYTWIVITLFLGVIAIIVLQIRSVIKRNKCLTSEARIT